MSNNSESQSNNQKQPDGCNLLGAEWIDAAIHPLYRDSEDDDEAWISNISSDQLFVAAVQEFHSDSPGKVFWWIKLCYISEEGELMTVGEDDSEMSGWGVDDVMYYILVNAPR